MIRRFSLALFLSGLAWFAGVYTGMALTEHVAAVALAREIVALQVKQAAEAQLVTCRFPPWGRR